MNTDARTFEPASSAFEKSMGLNLLDCVLSGTTVAALVIDESHKVIWANRAFEKLTGFGATATLGHSIERFGAGRGTPTIADCAWSASQLGRTAACKIYLPTAGGDDVPALLEMSSLANFSGQSCLVATLTGDSKASSAATDRDASAVHDIVAKCQDGLLVIDKRGAIAFCNASAAALFGRSEQGMVGTPFGFPFTTGDEWTSLEMTRRGKPVYIDMQTRAVSWQGDDATLATLRDVTERHEVEVIVAMQLKAMEATANGIFITDAKGRMKWVNDAITRISGYGREELISQPADLLRSDTHDTAFFEDMWAKITLGQTWRGQITNRHKEGHTYTAEQSITPIHDKAGRLTHFVAIQEDVTAKLKAQEDIVRLAEIDSLTNLPNRDLFMDRVGTALERAARGDRQVAVIVMDLDHFKDINNTLGHDVGDDIIISVTKRVKDLMRTTDTMARLGGDEFGVLLEDLENMNAASRMVRRILDTFDEPLVINQRVIKLTASIGISAYPEDDVDPLNLMRHAELAMYRAKSDGGHAFQYFDQAMDDEIRSRVSLERDLREAIKEQQLWLAYQPQINLKTGKVIGAEALLRWSHPQLGFISPGAFIPIAEACGLILPIGDWIIEEICRQTSVWRAAGMPHIQMGINISGHQFKQRELATQVLGQLSRKGLDIDAVDLEITETVAMERTEQVTRNVDQLVEAGISISMDDFGTGYSSLSNLQAFPVRRLKVDGSFVRGIGSHQGDEKIIEAVVGLGHSMGLTIIAEGVETEEQVAFLKDRACDEIQGYLISKPLPAVEFEAFLVNRTQHAV
ncbi:MAG: EAL domain-containing protein [Rhodospirillaceae bacterium]